MSPWQSEGKKELATFSFERNRKVITNSELSSGNGSLTAFSSPSVHSLYSGLPVEAAVV